MDKKLILHLPSGHCKYHPEPAQYDAGVLAGSTKPVGMFPCCGQNTLRFDPTQSNQVYCAYQFDRFSREIITARKRSLRRLCFYRYLSVHGGGGVLGRGVRGKGVCVAGRACMAGGMHGRGVCMAGGWHAWQGGCVAGGHAWQRACMAGGCAWQGACMAGGMRSRGACVADTTRYGQWAGGTHPTGMHSCLQM